MQNKEIISKLKQGYIIQFRPRGNSMTPKIKSGELVTICPTIYCEKIKKGDIVYCKVKGNIYLHLVRQASDGKYLIGNNYGKINGWTKNIYGKFIKMDKYDSLIRVGIESPFAAPTKEGIEENIKYARACVKDSLKRGEAPYASHLFFTQEGLLDDTVEEERMLGIMAGKKWEEVAEYNAVYIDRGLSKGMKLGIEVCNKKGRYVVYRSLGEEWMTDEGKAVLETVKLS